MANKRVTIGWIILCAASLAGALVTFVLGIVFASAAAKTGVVPTIAVISAALTLGLALLSAGGLALLWRHLRRG